MKSSINNNNQQEENIKVEWHLDKKFSISILFLLISNLISGAWWASEMSSKMDHLVKLPDKVEVLEKDMIKMKTKLDLHDQYLGRLDHVLQNFELTLDRVATEQARRTTIIEKAEQELIKKSSR